MIYPCLWTILFLNSLGIGFQNRLKLSWIFWLIALSRLSWNHWRSRGDIFLTFVEVPIHHNVLTVIPFTLVAMIADISLPFLGSSCICLHSLSAIFPPSAEFLSFMPHFSDIFYVWIRHSLFHIPYVLNGIFLVI